MSDTKSPVDQKNENQEHVPTRGHPQQHQGHRPNQEQVGSEEWRGRQTANDTEGKRNQSQQQEDAREPYKNRTKDHLELVKK
ncbi:hypothetical protein J2X56_003005 [Herbaspirillum sp. 1173]|uniref:hypothetical protein n=1 Tax=Herbaspirillum sp. 1173 TaxID=2817734 RepID=UPI0011A5284B|nr:MULTISPECIES: hypothetical protein [unclassified Herbaspirillum]MDR6740981.1 hypothetical protein [Herbaspirillum sp. 1173]